VASEVADYDLRALATGLGVDFLSLASNQEVDDVVAQAADVAGSDRPVLVDVAIDYSEKTFFTRGVVKTNLLRLPLRDQLRFVGRALKRKVLE
jgi:acetolactate synthase-1/2/3 large subunit